MDVRASDLPCQLDAPALQMRAGSLRAARQSMTDMKETAWWMLVILASAALVYDVAWYGGIIARIQ